MLCGKWYISLPVAFPVENAPEMIYIGIAVERIGGEN